MRTRVVISTSVLAILVLAPAIYFHFAPSSSPSVPSAPAPVAAIPQASAAPVAAVPAHHWTTGPADGGRGMDAPPLAADLGAPDHEDYVINRQGELAQLGMSDDPADLKTITSELNNKDPRIRSSALSAAVQFGSQDAIPALQNEMQWTDDPQEKVDLMNAIKYLQLPSFQASQATDQTPPTN